MTRRSGNLPPFPEHLRRLVRSEVHPDSVVTLVAGPAGSGKTTLVNACRKRGDLVIDIDALYVALSGQPWNDKPENLLPFVCEARDAVIDKIASGAACRAWVITANGNMRELAEAAYRLRASVIVLAVDPLECERRIAGDPWRDPEKAYTPIIRDWWEKYERTRECLPPSAQIITE